MPTVTASPVRIDSGPVTISRCLPDCGPFEIGGALYVVLCGQFDPDNFVRVYKSTDGGLAWFEQDSVNAVQASNHYRMIRVGDTFQIFYVNWNTDSLDTINFDSATDTYGANNASGLHGVLSPFKVAWDGTDFLAIYPKADSVFPFTVTNVHRVRLTSGAWGTPLQLFSVSTAPTAPPQITGLVMDATRAYFFYSDTLSAALKFRTLSASDSLSSATTIQAATVRTGQPYLSGSNLYLPVDDRRSGTATPGAALLWTGTPLAAPVWSAALIQTSSPVVIESIAMLVASPTAISFFYVGASDNLLYLTTFDGSTFAADVVYYDALTNPVPGVLPANQAMYGVGAGLTGSRARVVVQLNYDNSLDDTTFYLIAGSSPSSRYLNRLY